MGLPKLELRVVSACSAFLTCLVGRHKTLEAKIPKRTVEMAKKYIVGRVLADGRGGTGRYFAAID